MRRTPTTMLAPEIAMKSSRPLPPAFLRLAPALLSFAFAAALTALLEWWRPTFWHVYDTLDEFGPYSREESRLLWSGQPPVLTARSFSGGHLLMDFDRSVFHPVSLFISALWQVVDDLHVIALAFAIIILFATCLGAYLVGRELGLSRRYAMLLGITHATGPIFLYVYVSSWWNSALGTASFVWAVAALLHAVRRPRPLAFLCLGLGTAVLFSAGWPHAYLAYAVTCMVVVGTAVVTGSELRGQPRRQAVFVLRYAATVVAGLLVALPALAEYVAVSSYLDRSNAVGSPDDFGVPGLGHVLGFANPLSRDFVNIFGGYQLYPVPMGFVTLAALLAIFFIRWDWDLVRRPQVAAMLVATIGFLLLTQSPSQLGPTRWPFRYLPFAGLALATLVYYVLDKGRLVTSPRRRWFAVLTAFALVVVSVSRNPSVFDRPVAVVILPAAMVAVIALAAWRFAGPRRFGVTAATSIAGIALLVISTPSLAAGSVATDATVPSALQLAQVRQYAGDGLILVTRGGTTFSPAVHSAARVLLGGAAVFNGYDPVINAAYNQAIGPVEAHAWIDDTKVAELSAARPQQWGECGLTALGITAVVTTDVPSQASRDGLQRCGFHEAARANGAAVYTRVSAVRAGDATVAVGDVDFTPLISADQFTAVRIDRSGRGGSLIFSRMYWPGYTASLNGQSLTVRDVDGYILAVDVPAGAVGELTLDYRPQTWPLAIAISACALSCLTAACGIAKLRRRAPSKLQ